MIDTLKHIQCLPYNRGHATLVFVSVLLSSLADMGLIASIYALIGGGAGERSGAELLVAIFGSLDLIDLVAICVFVLFAKILFSSLSVVLRSRFVFYTQQKLASILYHGVLAQEFCRLQSLSSAELVRVVANESQNVIKMVLLPLVTLVSEILPAFAIIGVAIYLEPQASSVSFLIVGVLGFMVFYYYRNRISEWGRIRAKTEEQITSLLIDSDRLLREVKLADRAGAFEAKLDSMLDDLAGIGHRQNFASDIPKLILEGSIYFGMVSFLVYGIVFTKNIVEIVGVIAVVGMTALRAIPAVYRSISSVNVIRFGLPVLKRISADLAAFVPSKEKQSDHVEARELVVDQLSYLRPELEKPVFSKISFVAKIGQIVGIKGVSGAGKSTFLNVMCGLLQSSGGKVLLNGNDVTSTGLYCAAKIRLVPQQPYVFSGSVFENVSLYSEDTADNRRKVVACLKAANIYAALGESEEEVVGRHVFENSKNISGGQSQRIAMARSLFDDPQILVLDEFTSALDEETQSLVISELQKLAAGKIIVLVSHSGEVLRHCDIVVDLNKVDKDA